MGTSTIYHGTDTWVNSVKPTGIYYQGSWLRFLSPGAGTEYSFIRCNNPVPRLGTVTSVKLHLYGVGNWGAGTFTVSVQRAAAAWTDSKLNYNNRPAVTGSVVSVTQANPADGTEWIFDITALWQSIVNGASNYGLRISSSATVENKFYSFNAASFRPVFEFAWSDAPDAPTELSPAGGASVTLQRPVVNFNFHDVAGSTAMGGCRVQFKATNTGWTNTAGYAAPDWDSGTQATSDPELDTSVVVSTISSTLWAGLTVGSSAYWTVQVQDAAGVWSKWSDPVTFKRVARGALTLNSPTGGVISDPTQAVLWTLTGATQTAWQVTIADDSNPTKLLYDTKRISGNATSWTIPKGVITDESVLYRLTVRTWDDLTRTATPNDKIHTEVVATFTFSNSGTVDSVTGLTLSPRATRQPGMWLTWNRATAPDHYEIRRGSAAGSLKVVDTDLDPASLLVSGTQYHYLDRTANPFVTYVWRVVCKTSTGVSYGPTVTGEFDLDTTWLEDVSAGKLVPILFRDSGSDGVSNFDAPQVGATLQPNNATKVRRQTQGQVGLQGSVSGVIVDGYGDIADNWRKNLEWMRARPDNQLQLSTQGVNLTVVIGDVIIAPWRSREDSNGGARQVSFNFWEQ